jgi:NAD+ kinase
LTAVMVVAHHERRDAARLADEVAAWLRAHEHQVWMDPHDATALDLEYLSSDRPASSADLIVSLGGDGTTLRAISALGGAPVPVLAVNVGLLGYLAELEPEGLLPAVERWCSPGHGGAEIEERMMLDVAVTRVDGTESSSWIALNEAVVEKQEAGHTIRLHVSISGTPFTSYAADGLILATPTGSTAYSLSARGPVVSPHHRAILVTPVSPHMLFDRSLVLDPDEPVDVEIVGHRPATLTIDGRSGVDLVAGDRVRVSTSQHVARFVRFGPRHFHQILKAKFGLADR